MIVVTVTPAQPMDLDTVEALLQREQLPLDGLREHTQNMIVARAGNRIVGCASIELYAEAALLRSVAVDAEYRGFGVGSQLTRTALRIAELRGISIVYLLTNTAERFFPRFGFEIVDRADVPAVVQASAEFAHACPLSALVMRKFVTSPT